MKEVYPRTGLSWRDFNRPEKPKGMINRALEGMRNHPVATATSVILSGFLLAELYVIAGIDRYLNPPVGEVTPQPETKISISQQEEVGFSTDYIKDAWALLKEKQPDGGPSFLEQMQEEDRYVGQPIIFGSPRIGTVDERFKALGVRLVPSSDNGRFPPVEAVGGFISWIAEVVVINPDKSIEVFGLLAGHEKPAYVPLRSIDKEGMVTWYVRPPSTVDQERFSGK